MEKSDFAKLYNELIDENYVHSYNFLFPIVDQVEKLLIHFKELEDSRNLMDQVKLVKKELKEYLENSLQGTKDGRHILTNRHDTFSNDLEYYLIDHGISWV